MRPIALVLSVLAFIAGAYYMLNGGAVRALAGVEEEQLNRRRLRLRRVNGLLMMLFAISFCALCYWVDTVESAGPTAAALLLIVASMLLAILILVMKDLLLTWKLRERRRTPRDPAVS